MTTACAESINNASRVDRAYLIAMLDAVQALMCSWFHDYQKAASSCTIYLTPTMETILRERFTLAQYITITPLNQFEYNLWGNKLDSIVDLSQKCCSCRAFDIGRNFLRVLEIFLQQFLCVIFLLSEISYICIKLFSGLIC